MQKDGAERDGIKSKECVIVSLNCSSKVKQQQATGQMGGRRGGGVGAGGVVAPPR